MWGQAALLWGQEDQDPPSSQLLTPRLNHDQGLSPGAQLLFFFLMMLMARTLWAGLSTTWPLVQRTFTLHSQETLVLCLTAKMLEGELEVDLASSLAPGCGDQLSQDPDRWRLSLVQTRGLSPPVQHKSPPA